MTLWPIPTSATLTGELYAPQAVAEFSTLDTAVSLPPGYRRMLIKNLALCLCASYEREPRASLRQDAADSLATVKRSNKRLMDMQFEDGALVHGKAKRFYYNINTGP
jgi:hypothetical protein